jgi:hypothetical protein
VKENVDVIASTLSCEFFPNAAKFVGPFAPGFQLGGGLKLKGNLLLLNLLATCLDCQKGAACMCDRPFAKLTSSRSRGALEERRSTCPKMHEPHFNKVLLDHPIGEANPGESCCCQAETSLRE